MYNVYNLFSYYYIHTHASYKVDRKVIQLIPGKEVKLYEFRP